MPATRLATHAVARELPETLDTLFRSVRSASEQICAPLEIEDHVVQPAPFVSPPKWHLAHTTWFFDNFILCRDAVSGKAKESRLFGLLFNSYYKTQGEHWLQQHRGHLSRPTVKTVMAYRARVDEQMLELLAQGRLDDEERQLVTLGLHHEMQHQELLLMDIKYILGMTPGCPAYDEVSLPDATSSRPESSQWLPFESGMREIGWHDDGGFAFDNESPRHRIWQDAFLLGSRLVRNGDYLDFMEDGGYRRPELWLSDGWDWIDREGIGAPLYWRAGRPQVITAHGTSEWLEYHPGGMRPLDESLPVAHVSYYEADAYARWAGARLPTEAELEIAACQSTALPHAAFWRPGEKICPLPQRAADQMENGLLWQWTRSAYSPYPGYEAVPGAMGEYNGKFMSNQVVLRGGCVATPAHHWRSTYRNFYRPTDRWCFSGIRLARDAG